MRRHVLLSITALLFGPGPLWSQGEPLGSEFRVNTYTTGDHGHPAVAVAGRSGDFVAVWHSGGPRGLSSYEALGQRFAATGAGLGAEFRINTYTTGRQGHAGPAVALAGNGEYVVTWSSEGQDGSDFGVFGQRYSISGAPLGPEFRVNTSTAHSQALPSVAADALGNFVVVWHTSLFNDGVWGRRFARSGAARGRQFRVNTQKIFDGRAPVVASDAAGNFVVVWTREDDISESREASPGIFGQRFSRWGARLGPEFRVNTVTTGHQNYVQVASSAAGDFVVVWSGPDGSENGVFAQRFASTGAPLGGEFRVNTYTTDNQGRVSNAPAVASDAAGNFVIVWGSDGQAGASRSIFGQRFDRSGVPLGPEFRVNTYTLHNLHSATVGASADGDFVVLWASSCCARNGSYDIFGQRFGPIAPAALRRTGE